LSEKRQTNPGFHSFIAATPFFAVCYPPSFFPQNFKIFFATRKLWFILEWLFDRIRDRRTFPKFKVRGLFGFPPWEPFESNLKSFGLRFQISHQTPVGLG